MNPAGSCCGCDGGVPLTPVPVANRPGLDALAYRVGTYPTFFAAMRARLQEVYELFPALQHKRSNPAGTVTATPHPWPRCQPWPLSPEKFNSWRTITFNFDPRDY